MLIAKVLALITTTAGLLSAQFCTVGVNQPSAFFSGGIPVIWPKTTEPAAPAYVGQVGYFLWSGYYWGPPGNTLYYSSLSNAQLSAIYAAVYTWNNNTANNGSTVSIVWYPNEPQNPTPTPDGNCPTNGMYMGGCQRPYIRFRSVCDACINGARGQTTYLWVDYGYGANGGFPVPPGVPLNWYRLGIAYVDLNETNAANTLTGTVAHEIGHTMLLDDCPSCGVTSTLMYSPYDPSRPTGPTYCDNQQILNSNH